MTGFSELKRLLGQHGPDVAARALRCSRGRFSYPPRDTVAAILELVEAVVDRDGAEALPSRWRGEVPAVTADEIREAFGRLFADVRPMPIVARALGIEREAVADRMAGDADGRALAELAAIAELLDVLRSDGETRDWPDRWRACFATPDPAETAERIAAVLGPGGTARLARAVDLTPDYLGRILRSERMSDGRVMPVPEYVLAAIELLETLHRAKVPRSTWPARFGMRTYNRRAERESPATPPAGLGQPDARAAAVLCDELDAGRGEGIGERADDLG